MVGGIQRPRAKEAEKWKTEGLAEKGANGQTKMRHKWARTTGQASERGGGRKGKQRGHRLPTRPAPTLPLYATRPAPSPALTFELDLPPPDPRPALRPGWLRPHAPRPAPRPALGLAPR